MGHGRAMERRERAEKGYGNKGKGKNNTGGYYYSNYRSFGKGVGKGLNNMSEDWFNVWGSEEHYDYFPSEWWEQDGEQQRGYCGNLAILLERGGHSGETEAKTKTESNGNPMHRRHTGEHDPLRNASRAQPLTLHNRHYALHSDDDDSDIESDESDEDVAGHQVNAHTHIQLQFQQLNTD